MPLDPAAVVISPYLPDVLALSDRILVANRGKIVEEIKATEAPEQQIMYAAVHEGLA
ncbi:MULTISPECIES: hypothetical protein [Bradyrhizobium]|uniref:ABC transporter ATP-binding protein n=1 Tax=Bradyrhizobium vignae TaxID=1549949 RepID=A0ABS4A481_9BRAD|nr:hypothetical protein [Bradyrhizobium vignae]MBP0115221.1 hypothetical protein [Bradyrhizobium vignae]